MSCDEWGGGSVAVAEGDDIATFVVCRHVDPGGVSGVGTVLLLARVFDEGTALSVPGSPAHPLLSSASRFRPTRSLAGRLTISTTSFSKRSSHRSPPIAPLQRPQPSLQASAPPIF